MSNEIIRCHALIAAFERSTSVLRAIVLALATFTGLLCDAAFAQSAPPPVREMVDENGVDLLTGTMSATHQGLSIGSESGLSFSRAFRHNKHWDSYLGIITAADEYSTSYTVSIGGLSERFGASGNGVTVPAPPFFAAERLGSTLTYNGTWPSGTYVYTMSSGAVATFSRKNAAYGYPGATVATYRASLDSITYSNGERIDVTHHSETICVAYNGSCTNWQPATRIAHITNNHGYRLTISYAANSNPFAVDPNEFVRPVSLSLTNMADGSVRGPVTLSLAGSFQSGLETHITDMLGRTAIYRFAPNGGGLAAIRRPGSTADDITVTYTSGKVASVNNGGIVTTYAYSDSGSTRTTTVTRPGGAQRIVTSNTAINQPLTDRDELNRTTTYSYDAYSRLERVTAPEGNFVQYTYDDRGNVTQILVRAKAGSGLADITTTAGFDATCTNPKTCNQPNWTRDAKGNQTDYTYDPTHGGVLAITFPAPVTNGIRPQNRYGYTPLEAWYQNSSGTVVASGQPIYKLTTVSTCRTTSSCVDAADETKTIIGYGSPGAANNLVPLTVTSRNGTGTLTATATSTYDSVGNRLTIDGPLAGSADTVRTRYDSLRRVQGVIGPDPDGGGARKPIATRTSYDDQGRVVAIETGNVNSQSDTDWATFSAQEIVSIVYDSASRIVRTSLSAGGTTHAVRQLSYDARGRLDCAVTRMNPSGFASTPASACTLGAQGAFGPDRITKLHYNDGNQVTKVTAAFGTASALDEVTATHTNNGRVWTVADAKGNLTTFTYDGFDRLSRTNFPSPTSPGTSSSSDYEQLAYDSNSSVISVRRRNGQSIGFSRDNLNRISLRDVPGTTAEDVYFSYTNLGLVTSATFVSAAGPGISNAYDAFGRLETRTILGRTLAYQYDQLGNRTRVTHPDGFYASYAYNSFSELGTISDSTGATLATYTYDNLGRQVGYARTNGTSTSYDYDAASRLSLLTQNLSGTSYDNTTTLTYSPSSQIATRALTNDAVYSWAPLTTGAVNYTPNGLNQVGHIGSTLTTHDSSGNLASGESTWTYGFDSLNQLRSATSASNTVTFDYDPAGLLSTATSNGVMAQFLYDGSDLLAEYNGSGTLVRRYVHGEAIDEPLVWYEGSGTSDRRFFHVDERGSVIAISDNSGAGTASFSYSAYGESANAASSKFGFTGQAWLANVGLYYYKARMYSPKLGRFIQPDPIGYDDGMNMYAYVGGDPVNATDPSGLCDGCPRPPPIFSFPGALATWQLNGNTYFGDPFHYDMAIRAAQAGGGPVNGVCYPHRCAQSRGAFGSTVSGPLGAPDWATTSGICLGGCHGTTPDGALRPMTTAERLVLDGIGIVVTAPLGGEFIGAVKAGIAARGAAAGGRALVPAVDAVYATATERLVAGYNVWGTAGRVGSTYNVNILGLYATEGSQGLGALVAALRAEATAAGASRISIQGLAIINQGLAGLSARVAARFGLQLERVNGQTIILSGGL